MIKTTSSALVRVCIESSVFVLKDEWWLIWKLTGLLVFAINYFDILYSSTDEEKTVKHSEKAAVGSVNSPEQLSLT